jgi:cytochrome bd ubiquinol oxidase subunit I
VNGWMNNPTGFRIENGEVTDVKPLEALFNSHLPHEVVHMYLAGIMVAGFIVAAVYARGWLRGRRDRYHRAALVVPLTFAALAALVQPVVGDWAARTVAESQPVKLAAFEGLNETTEGADLNLGGIYLDGEVQGGIDFPKLLSLLAFQDPNATVEGLDAVPADDRPPVGIVRSSFQFMVIVGSALAGLALLHLAIWWRRRRLPRSKWFHRAVIAAGPLSLLTLIAGWVTTEVGRQPWVVYEVMRTEEAVTGLDGIPVGYGFLALVYLALGAIVAWLLRRLARQPVEIEA